MRVWLSRLGLVIVVGMLGCSSPTGTVVDPRAAETTSQEKPTSADKTDKGEPFRLPPGEVGKMLGQVLPPRHRPGALHNPGRPAPPAAPVPRFVAPPAPLPPASVELARLPLSGRRAMLRPDLATEERLDDGAPVNVPREPSFPTEKLARVDTEDVSIPPPLPLMATPVPDRVSLDDATMDVSTAAVLQAPLPRRETPVPFVRLSVPDPFEHRQPLTIPVPEEATTPQR
jgi:hypothetical protein